MKKGNNSGFFLMKKVTDTILRYSHIIGIYVKISASHVKRFTHTHTRREREREIERERVRERDRERKRQREKETDRHKQRERKISKLIISHSENKR